MGAINLEDEVGLTSEDTTAAAATAVNRPTAERYWITRTGDDDDDDDDVL